MKGRGRPAEVCSKICRERGRQRRIRAAKLLEYADRLVELAEEQRQARPSGWLTVEMIERRVATFEERAVRLREDAALELRGLPL